MEVGIDPLTWRQIRLKATIKPALGHLEVRKVCGPILDQLYSRLKRGGDLSCTGRPVIRLDKMTFTRRLEVRAAR